LLEGTDRLIVPDLLLGEVGHSLRVNLDRERLTLDEAKGALDDLLQVPLEWVSAATVAREALQLVIARKGPFFDPVDVALARARGCSVIASDRGMEEKYSSLGVVTRLSELP
jgi:predicted nucleic acid-binding protein